MAFPDGWPPRPSPGALNIAFLAEGTATTSYEDNAFLFIDGIGANPFQPTPYVEPGQEKLNTPITPYGPGTPLGTGRDARDVVPFNPNVFYRGNGLGTAQTTFTFDAPTDTVTYTDFTKKFDRGMLNKSVRIQGATSGGHNGTFKITAFTDRSISWVNSAGGAVEDLPVTGEFRIRLVDEAPPKAAIWSSSIRVINKGAADLYLSFNGVDDQGIVPAGATHVYRSRAEAGMAVKASAGTVDFCIEAW